MSAKTGVAERFAVRPVVFGFSVGLTVLFLVLTMANLGAADAMFGEVKKDIARRFGWFFILNVQGFLLLCIYLAANRFGHIRIGGPDARPEFSAVSWFAMLFAAGLGIGLMFWSVAEPVLHLQDPPGAAPMTPEGVQRAIDLAFLHWGLHVWGIYALIGLALASTSLIAICVLPLAGNMPAIIGMVLVIGYLTHAVKGLYWALLDLCPVPRRVIGLGIGLVSFIGYLPDVLLPLYDGFLSRHYARDVSFQICFTSIALFGYLGAALRVVFWRRSMRAAANS